MVAEANVPLNTAASHTSSNNCVGGAERFKHPCQAILLFLGLRLLVGTIEILESESKIIRESLQQFDQFGRERCPLKGVEDDHAHRLAAIHQWQRRHRLYTAVP